MRGTGGPWLAALVMLSSFGCGGGLTVRGVVRRPAVVPVRAFPHIVISADQTPEANEVADRVARHLGGGRSDVERLGPTEVERARLTGRLARGSVVMQIGVHLSRRSHPEWRPQGLSCGTRDCMDDRGPMMEDVAIVSGLLVLRVSDGPSGRALQREEITEDEDGADLIGAHLRVIARLGQRALELLDQRSERVTVVLYPVSAPRVERALSRIRLGQWSEGRRDLERFTHSRAFGALAPDDRARVLYDLGQARRFDATIPAERRFSLAAEALRGAVRLRPERGFADAIQELESHRQSRAMVREQEEAMAHNFELARRAGGPGGE